MGFPRRRGIIRVPVRSPSFHRDRKHLYHLCRGLLRLWQ